MYRLTLWIPVIETYLKLKADLALQAEHQDGCLRDHWSQGLNSVNTL